MAWHFPPTGNPNLLQVATGELFDGSSCDRVVSALRPDAFVPSKIEGRDASGALTMHVDPAARSVDEQALPDGSDTWVLPRIADAVVEANARLFHFDLTGFSANDVAVVLRYEAETSDWYLPHIDLGAGESSTRKLSFTVQLTDPADYDGGDLVFPIGRRRGDRARGSITIFPAYAAHMVEPVTRGRRLAIVGWVHGPAFR